MVGIVREVLAQWHDDHYAKLEDRLRGLTPVRNGVPFTRAYTEVWHYVFGVANRILVERGLFADPYAAGREHRGVLPVLWDRSAWKEK